MFSHINGMCYDMLIGLTCDLAFEQTSEILKEHWYRIENQNFEFCTFVAN